MNSSGAISRSEEARLPISRLDLWLVAVFGLVVFAVQAIAWPLHPVGRDFLSYMRYYVDFGVAEPKYPMLMVRITPLPSLFFGTLMDFGSPMAAEVALGALFSAGMVGVYLMGSPWGRVAGWLSVCAVACNLPLCALLHTSGSDSPFALALMIWGGLVCATRPDAPPWHSAAHGFAIFMLTLIRPVGPLWLAMAGWPLFLALPWRARIVRSGAIAATAGVLLVGWAATNWVRFDDFTVARGGGAQWPFYRVFVQDHLIAPENGPQSQKLADAVRDDLLTRDPYRGRGVTLDEFFASGSPHYWNDLVPLSDRTWGWASRYSVLRGAASEALAASPGPFWRHAAEDVRKVMSQSGDVPKFIRRGRLPTDFEGYQWAWASAPDGRFIPLEALNAIADDPRFRLPDRDGYRPWTLALHKAARLFPPPLFWLIAGVLGIVALAATGRRVEPALPLLAAIGVFSACSSVVGTDDSFRYRLVYDPFIVTFGVVGLVSVCSATARLSRSNASVRP